MKGRRFVPTSFVMVTICCVALLDSGTSTSLSSQDRRLRMDDLIASTAVHENSTQSAAFPVDEAEERVENGTVLQDAVVGTVIKPSPNASNITDEDDVTKSPTQSPSALLSMQPTYASSTRKNDDANATIGTMTNWMTSPVILNSDPSIEETSIELLTNTTSTELNSTSLIELDMPNSTNTNSSVTVIPSTLAPSVTPQFNETTNLEKAESTSNTNNTFDAATSSAPTMASSSSSSPTTIPTVAPTNVNSPTTMTPSVNNPTPLSETAVPSNLDNATTTIVPPPTSTPTVEPTLDPSANPTPPLVLAASRSAPPTSTPTFVGSIESPTFTPSMNLTQQSNIPTASSLDNATLHPDLVPADFSWTTSAPPTFTPTIVETVESPTFIPSMNLTQQSDAPTASSLDNATLHSDLVPAAFNWTTSAPPTSAPTIVETVESPTSPPSNPTQQSDIPTASSLDNATLPPDLVTADFAFNSTASAPPTIVDTIESPTFTPSANPTQQSDTPTQSSLDNATLPPDLVPADFSWTASTPPTSTPTIAETIESPTFTPSSDFPTAYYPPSAYVYSPPFTKEEVSTEDDVPAKNSTNTDSPPSLAPTQLPPTESPSSNPTSIAPSIDPTAQPTHHDDHDDETHNDKSAAITTSLTPTKRPSYPPTINTSPIPTPWPTYSPTTTEEANDAIYPKYHPTYMAEEEEDADSPPSKPTYYPTYYPTTLRKGNRVRERRKKRLSAPTESPTVVKIEFLEDVSASKTMAAVIGVILTIIGIGCCAWCV